MNTKQKKQTHRQRADWQLSGGEGELCGGGGQIRKNMKK